MARGDQQGRLTLEGCRVLVLEDEYFLASDLKEALSALGAEVIGPIPDLDSAHDQVAEGGFDVAIIDINLRDKAAYSIADALRRNDIPFVFATGYSEQIIPARFRDVIRWEKPFEMGTLMQHVEKLCKLATA